MSEPGKIAGIMNMYNLDTLLTFRLFTQVFSAVLSLSLALFVLWKGSGKPVNRVFAGIAFASCHYNVFQVLFSISPAVALVKVGYAGAILLIPLLTEFPDAVLGNHYARPRTRAVAFGLAVFFLALLPTDLILQGTLDRSGSVPLVQGGFMMIVYAAVMAWALLRIAWRLAVAFRSTSDQMLRRRIEFILLGEAFYVVCALHDVLLRQQLFWIFDFPIVEWATLAFMIITAYATLRYRLVDVDVVLGMGVYYSLLTLGTAAVYRLVESLLENHLQKYVSLNSWYAQLLPAFVVAIMFGLLNDLSNRLKDHFFLPESLREMKLFRSPDFQFLVLDQRREELRELRNEIDRLIDGMPDQMPAHLPPPDSGKR